MRERVLEESLIKFPVDWTDWSVNLSDSLSICQTVSQGITENPPALLCFITICQGGAPVCPLLNCL
jgi:hypothetical protein